MESLVNDSVTKLIKYFSSDHGLRLLELLSPLKRTQFIKNCAKTFQGKDKKLRSSI